MKWQGDAALLDIGSLDKIIYTTEAINAFLTDSNKMFLSASKGMGKTLLLTRKRDMLMSRNNSPIFIPKSRPYLDNNPDFPDLSKPMCDFMAKHAKSLWLFSIKLSVLSYLDLTIHPDEHKLLKKLPMGYYEYIIDNTRNYTPTEIFSQMLRLTPTEIFSLLETFQPTISHLFQDRVHTAVYVFIDKIDQGFKTVTQQAWIDIQGALIEAAWGINSVNSHVKVFASIRKEAYSNYETQVKLNLDTSTVALTYEKDDLVQMMYQLSLFYENKSLGEFLGREAFFNEFINEKEQAIDFLIRFSLGRPRDLVTISNALSLKGSKLDNEQFVMTVMKQCGTTIIPTIFSEVKIFLLHITDREIRGHFFSLLPYNILTREEMEEIFLSVNRVTKDHTMRREDMMHPFSDLYKAGLLGYVNDRGEQTFLQPEDLQNYHSTSLPKSNYYLLHPAMRDYILGHDDGNEYRNFRYIKIGHRCPWLEPFYSKMIKIERLAFQIDDLELMQELERFLSVNAKLIKAGSKLPRDADIIRMESTITMASMKLKRTNKTLEQKALELLRIIEGLRD